MTIISMEFVSATVKRDKVLRMIEKGGTMKELLKKKEEEGAEEMQKFEQNGAQKEAEKTEEGKKPAVVFI